MARIGPQKLFSDVSSSEAGSISVIFALSLLPVIAMSGAALDYSRAMGFKSEL